MSPEVKTESELEIAHVLFIDTVGYSKLLINEQREVFDALTRLVKESDQFRKADAAGNLVRLPTGDGMALVFSGSLEAPAQCALEISTVLRDVPSLLAYGTTADWSAACRCKQSNTAELGSISRSE
jgi:hypothetical protein